MYNGNAYGSSIYFFFYLSAINPLKNLLVDRLDFHCQKERTLLYSQPIQFVPGTMLPHKGTLAVGCGESNVVGKCKTQRGSMCTNRNIGNNDLSFNSMFGLSFKRGSGCAIKTYPFYYFTYQVIVFQSIKKRPCYRPQYITIYVYCFQYTGDHHIDARVC